MTALQYLFKQSFPRSLSIIVGSISLSLMSCSIFIVSPFWIIADFFLSTQEQKQDMKLVKLNYKKRKLPNILYTKLKKPENEKSFKVLNKMLVAPKKYHVACSNPDNNQDNSIRIINLILDKTDPCKETVEGFDKLQTFLNTEAVKHPFEPPKMHLGVTFSIMFLNILFLPLTYGVMNYLKDTHNISEQNPPTSLLTAALEISSVCYYLYSHRSTLTKRFY